MARNPPFGCKAPGNMATVSLLWLVDETVSKYLPSADNKLRYSSYLTVSCFRGNEPESKPGHRRYLTILTLAYLTVGTEN